MKHLFKNIIAAATIASTIGSALAGTVSVTKQPHSQEGLGGVNANQTSNNISYTLGAGYAVGDKITFTFTTGALSANPTFADPINVPAVNNAVEANAIAGLTLNRTTVGTDSVVYTVGTVTQPDNGGGVPWPNATTTGTTVVLGSVAYKAAAVTAAPVTVSVSSETAGAVAKDIAGTRTATVAEAKSQFGTVSVTTKFDNLLNGANADNSFVGALNDTVAFTISNPVTIGWLNLATVNANSGTVVTLKGEAGKWTGMTGSHFSSTGTGTLTEAAASYSVSYAGLKTGDTFTFTPPTAGTLVTLKQQSFTLDVAYNYTSAGAVAGSKTLASGTSAGAWGLSERVPTLSQWVMIFLTVGLVLAGVQQVKKFSFLNVQG